MTRLTASALAVLLGTLVLGGPAHAQSATPQPDAAPPADTTASTPTDTAADTPAKPVSDKSADPAAAVTTTGAAPESADPPAAAAADPGAAPTTDPGANSAPAPQPKEAGTATEEDLYQSALQSIADGRKMDASKTLMRVIDKQPQHAGAWLDLAMIQCALGRVDEAERLFAAVETRFQPSAAMLEVIAGERERGCNHWKPVSSLALNLGRGNERNVNQGASDPSHLIELDGVKFESKLLPEFMPQQDQYTLLSGEYTREATRNGSVAFAQFQARHNDTLSSYDTASLYAGLETPHRFGRWTMRTTAMMGLVSLGGRLYQRQLQLQARLGAPVPFLDRTQFELMGGMTHSSFLKLANFDSETYELRTQLSYRRPNLHSSVSLGYLHDHAAGERPGGDRNGWFVNLAARQQLSTSFIGELSYTRQSWLSDEVYLPKVISQVREQATHVLRGALFYPLAKNHRLQLETRIVRNRENISLFQYNNHQLQLSWQWQQP